MAFRLPFRSIAAQVAKAAGAATPELWRSVGALLDRNFAAIEKALGHPDGYPNKRVYSLVPSVDRTTTSATFVDWPVGQVLSGTFTKRHDDTRIIVTLLLSGFLAGAGGAVDYGVSVDGAAGVLVKNGFINTVSEHQGAEGAVEITGLTAGDHTFEVQARTTAGTLTADANDQITMTVEEVA